MEKATQCSVSNGLAALMLCQQGMGIAPVAEFAAAQFLAEGQLVRVLPSYGFPSSLIYIRCASEPHLSSRVKRMTEFLQENLQLSIAGLI
ncbi:MAG: LysR substrate-binding domain-containing protein [Oculatellaceae cyanobacterium Prado106]|nr:LysR substrate-binding domain-containing protein [Oculatellaceae cyanobacterium Prado106]